MEFLNWYFFQELDLEQKRILQLSKRTLCSYWGSSSVPKHCDYSWPMHTVHIKALFPQSHLCCTLKDTLNSDCLPPPAVPGQEILTLQSLNLKWSALVWRHSSAASYGLETLYSLQTQRWEGRMVCIKECYQQSSSGEDLSLKSL